MKCIEVNRSFLFVFHTALFTTVACFPVQTAYLGPESRDEKRLPNGTTIGKYTYMDNEGNPIQVKYYADEASYGVELKSIKVVDRGGNIFQPSSQQPLRDSPNGFDKESDAKTALNLLDSDSIALTYKNHEDEDPYNLNKDIRITNRYKAEKPNPDYEIFYQNELKAGGKCSRSKDKVHVYFDDNERRKIRSAVDNLAEANKFCEQF